MYSLPTINPKEEKQKIIYFLQETLKKQNIKNTIIGMSAGVDSTTSFYLLKEAISPQNIFVAHLYYFDSQFKIIKDIIKKANIPNKNVFELSIKNLVDEFKKTLNINENDENYNIRLGNIMARTRMILLYDLAKKHNALVLGTEDKSEFLLGYFTRFGDEASDIEPIRHLYKTQISKLAEYLGVPQNIIKRKPSPNLWPGHIAEDELGFSYKEADIALYLYYDRKLSLGEIKKMGLPNAEKIINSSLRNSFKHRVPYVIK